MWSFFSKDPTRDFNYEIGELIAGIEEKSIWKLHKARKKSSGDVFSVFVFDLKLGGSETQMDLAKASVKRLKTMRHPNILTFVDSLEGPKEVFLVTEYVEPLETKLTTTDTNDTKRNLAITWGIHQLTRALSFLNNDCGFAHHNVCMPSVFVNQAGEWKLGGFEYLVKGTDLTDAPFPIKIIPQLEKYDPPEKNDSKRTKTTKIWSSDMWGLGCLIWESFNGNLTKQTALKTPGKVPKTLIPLYCELVGANPSSRPSPAEFLSRCRSDRGFMKNNFIDTLLFLEEIQIKDANEKTRFFGSLPQHVDRFPEEICRYKILPQLLSDFEYGGAGPAILTPLFKLGKLLNEDEYQKKIIPCVVKLFSSTDRATRAKLLQQLDQFVDHLQANVINSQVFPELVHGFMDTNATIREVTVKSILHLAPKLNYNNLNVELMKHFARLQAKDTEGGIRTNTTVCLGKISHHLHPETRRKVLVTAFTRAMRDPFPAARTAGILALAATQKFYSLEDVSRRVLPAICQMTTDPEKSVRDQAFKAIKGFLGKLEKVSDDPSLCAEFEAEVNAASSVSTADSAIGWAGWAVTSLTSKLYKPSQDKKNSKPVSVSSSVVVKNVDSLVDVSTSKPSNLTTSPRNEVENKQQDSESDYEDDDPTTWGGSWGEMDSSIGKDALTKPGTNDGWDTGWDDADFESVVENPNVTSISNYNWCDKADEDTFKAPKEIAKPTSSNETKPRNTEDDSTSGDTWSSGWETFADGVENQSAVDKDDREQRRAQRRKEIAEKRAQKQSGPMKLGERRKL